MLLLHSRELVRSAGRAAQTLTPGHHYCEQVEAVLRCLHLVDYRMMAVLGA